MSDAILTAETVCAQSLGAVSSREGNGKVQATV